ncbi:AAEL013751-PA [Aedes aegypti]|uniref:AAEL013751-PA n=1 Tax=Aedes aegypti TaxID=7159 RepID=Q16I94_AEDAE|nr:AAEL013751-PA [Aedes aegypti]
MSLLLRSSVQLRKLSPRTIQQQATRNFLTKKKCPSKPEEETQCGKASASAVNEIAVGYKLLKDKQAKFQIKDNLPVWLKGGPMDRMLYLSTVGLSVVGLGSSLAFISMMALNT